MLQKLTLILSASLLLTLTGFGTAIGAPKAPAADKKGAKAAEAPAEAPKPKPKPKPPLQRIRHAENGVSYKIVVRPGVPAVGKTFVVEVELAEILKVRHVRYGDRKPMDKADFQAILVAPKPKKRRAKRAAPIVRTGFKMKDAGTYGLTFTPTTAGLYSLHLRGKSSDGKIISYSMKMPVDVWPVPEDAIIEDIPKKLPATTLGNMENGKALCIERCRADLNFALYDKEDTLVSLSSEKVAGMNDSQFLKEILRDGSGSLSEMARNDILYYLHTTHLAITDLVPEASVIIANNFEINNYGIERLEKSLGKKPSDEELIARVFAIYKSDKKSSHIKAVAFDDTVGRSQLDKKDKMAYIIFTTLPGDKSVHELAIAIEKEASYKIISIIARGKDGKPIKSINKNLKRYVGQGRFNDKRSLKGGSSSLRKKLVPVFLRAAEFGTMYFSAEREFTAFDSEFAD